MMEKKIRSSIEYSIKRRLFKITWDALFVILLLITTGIIKAQSETLIIKGIAGDQTAKPLKDKYIMIMPVKNGEAITLQRWSHSPLSRNTTESAGKKWSYYTMVGDVLNPRVLISPNGQFLIGVQKQFLDSYFKPEELSLGVIEAEAIHYEPYIFKYDRNADTIDVGKILFKPIEWYQF
jgi:hypothetical protein